MSDRLTAWESVAPGWERRRELVWNVSHEVGEKLVDALDPQTGATIMELACGTGASALPPRCASARRGGSCRPISRRAWSRSHRRSSAELGLANVEHRVVDCEAIDLLSATVDGVLRRPASGLPHSPRLLQRFSQ